MVLVNVMSDGLIQISNLLGEESFAARYKKNGKRMGSERTIPDQAR